MVKAENAVLEAERKDARDDIAELEKEVTRLRLMLIRRSAGRDAQTEPSTKPAASENPGGEGHKGPASTFYGIRGNAHNVVYVVDRSGSTIETFVYIRGALIRSIGSLRPTQYFSVLLFSDKNPLEFRRKGLVPATEENKQKARQFLRRVHSGGQTNPVPALIRGIKLLKEDDNSEIE